MYMIDGMTTKAERQQLKLKIDGAFKKCTWYVSTTMRNTEMW